MKFYAGFFNSYSYVYFNIPSAFVLSFDKNFPILFLTYLAYASICFF